MASLEQNLSSVSRKDRVALSLRFQKTPYFCKGTLYAVQANTLLSVRIKFFFPGTVNQLVRNKQVHSLPVAFRLEF